MSNTYNKLGNFTHIGEFTSELNKWLIYEVDERQDDAVIAFNGEAYYIHQGDEDVIIYSADNRDVYAYFDCIQINVFNQLREFALPVAQVLFQQGLIQSMGSIAIDSLEVFSGVGGLNHILWCELVAGNRSLYNLARSYQNELFTNERGG